MSAVRRDFVLAVMHDYAPGRADETFRWFDFDHVPERISGGSVLEVERYSRVDARVPFVTPEQAWIENINFYFLDALDYLTSDAYHRYFDMNGGRGSVWRQEREHLPGGPSPSRGLRSVWRRRENPNDWRRAVWPNSPKTLLVVLRDIAPSRADEINAVLDADVYPILLSAPGVWAVDRYEASGLDLASTSNRAALNHPQFMDVFFLATPEVVTGGQFTQATQHLRAFHAENVDDVTIRGASVYIERPRPWSVAEVVGPTTLAQ